MTPRERWRHAHRAARKAHRLKLGVDAVDELIELQQKAGPKAAGEALWWLGQMFDLLEERKGGAAACRGRRVLRLRALGSDTWRVFVRIPYSQARGRLP